MDRLDSLIEKKRREVEDLRRKLQFGEVELHTLEQAAKARPLKGGRTTAPTAASNLNDKKDRTYAGKPKGAISKVWRDVLRRMFSNGNPFRDFDAIFGIVGKAGIDAIDKSVRDRLTKYVADGILDQTDEGYRVSRDSIDRFGLNDKT